MRGVDKAGEGADEEVVTQEQREDVEEVRDNPRLRTMQPEEESSDEDERGKQWGVIGIRGAKRSEAGGISYEVVWEACEETHGVEEVTWEQAEDLKKDKMGSKIGGFWRSRAGKELKGQWESVDTERRRQ